MRRVFEWRTLGRQARLVAAMAPIIVRVSELIFAAKIEDMGNETMRRWAGQAAAGIGVLALCFTTGCNGFFVYPGSTGSGGTGSVLPALSGSPYAAGSSVDALAVDRTGNYLLAAAFGGSSDLMMYTFDSTTAGKLDLSASTKTGANDPTGPIAVAAGNYVYVANATASTLSGFSLSPGALTPVANSPYTLPFTPTAVAVNPANTYLYVGTSTAIYGYSIGAGGALTPLNAVIVPVQSMDISPDGQWLFVLDGNGQSIDEFQITLTTGILNLGPTTIYSGSVMTPRAIKIAPNGAYVFVALGTGGDLVYTFNTAATSGALTNPLTLPAPTSPLSDNALAVSPDSSTLYIARSNSTSAGTVAAYSIGSGGSLTFKAQGTTGVQPYSVVVNVAGTNVYVANRSDGTISGFSTTATKP